MRQGTSSRTSPVNKQAMSPLEKSSVIDAEKMRMSESEVQTMHLCLFILGLSVLNLLLKNSQPAILLSSLGTLKTILF